MRPLALALMCVACAATARTPAPTEACAVGWTAFSRGDTHAAISAYGQCERASALPAKEPTPADGGLEARMASEAAEESARMEAAQRHDCPRTTMVREAVAALERLAAHDSRGFRHLMTMSCFDALVGKSAVERAIHPCVVLESPPRVDEIEHLRAALERHMPPACFTGEPPVTFEEPQWWCVPPGK